MTIPIRCGWDVDVILLQLSLLALVFFSFDQAQHAHFNNGHFGVPVEAFRRSIPWPYPDTVLQSFLMPASSLASASAATATAWKSYASPKQADLAGPAEVYYLTDKSRNNHISDDCLLTLRSADPMRSRSSNMCKLCTGETRMSRLRPSSILAQRWRRKKSSVSPWLLQRITT